MIFGLSVGLSSGLIFGLSSGLIFGLSSGLSSGLSGGAFGWHVSGTPIKTIETVNWSWKMFLQKGRSGLIRGLSGLIFELIVGLIVGLTVGFNRGGAAAIKHYALRFVLWRNGHTPFNFIKFLDYCAQIILLKKVGGGYIFIHRMLLEYFAGLKHPR